MSFICRYGKAEMQCDLEPVQINQNILSLCFVSVQTQRNPKFITLYERHTDVNAYTVVTGECFDALGV